MRFASAVFVYVFQPRVTFPANALEASIRRANSVTARVFVYFIYVCLFVYRRLNSLELIWPEASSNPLFCAIDVAAAYEYTRLSPWVSFIGLIIDIRRIISSCLRPCSTPFLSAVNIALYAYGKVVQLVCVVPSLNIQSFVMVQEYQYLLPVSTTFFSDALYGTDDGIP